MMVNQSRTSSNLSMDSLELSFNRRSESRERKVETILVPFYEKDVLIKVPKAPLKTTNKKKKNSKKEEKPKQETEKTQSYLMNKDSRHSKKTSYLAMFRKQFTPNCVPITNNMEDEIRSLSPQFGDTELESIGETNSSPIKDFYNTESYNEIYYEKLMNQEISHYLEQTFEQALHFTEDIESKSPEDCNNNFKSISETSHPRRPAKRTITDPVQSVLLGGLGPDLENIKPRLERARSLQRYSEKVRMENRLKIYRKTIETDNEKKSTRDTSAKQRTMSSKVEKDPNASYLVNKSLSNKSPLARKLCPKSKSADIQNRCKEKRLKEKNSKDDDNKFKEDVSTAYKNIRKSETKYSESKPNQSRVKTSARSQNAEQNKNGEPAGIPPVQINFLVNVNGIRPSTALRTLEEKHKMYQEKVKAFKMDKNNDV